MRKHLKKRSKQIYKKGERGITLIALVITIIVLVILASVSISMLSGDNGILNSATDARKNTEKAIIEEKIKLAYNSALIKGKGKVIDTVLEDEMKKEFKERFTNNELPNGWLDITSVTGKWRITIDDVNLYVTAGIVTDIENFNLNVDNVYASVEFMKADTNLTEGKLVQTEGYYTKSLGGGAYYDIVDNTELVADNRKCIQLNNGLYAELHVINDSITVNQFGAYGDGIHDDVEAIQAAIISGYENVILEENNEYKICNILNFSQSNVTLWGNNSVIFTDNDYNNNNKNPNQWKEWAVIIHSNNINIDSLNMYARENTKVGYSGQLYIGDCNNVNIRNSSFIIPETASSSNGYKNIDCYTDWHNVVIEDCTLVLKNDALTGGCIWIRDLRNKGCDNLTFKNNNCSKITHDEILAVYMGTIQNVTISNNTFLVEEKNSDPSVMNFTIGSEDSLICDNIIFEENQITSKARGGLIYLTNSSNVKIRNNLINFTATGTTEQITYVVRDVSMNSISEVSGNTINCYSISDEKEIRYLFSDFKNKDSIIKENIINGYCKIEYGFNNCVNVDNNNVTLNNTDKETNVIFNNCVNITNNNVTSNRCVTKVFQWYNQSWTENVYVTNNTINFAHDTKRLLHINGCTMNNNELIVTNNKINCNVGIKVDLFLIVTVKDDSPQTVRFKGNNFGLYKTTNVWFDPSNQNIIFED